MVRTLSTCSAWIGVIEFSPRARSQSSDLQWSYLTLFVPPPDALYITLELPNVVSRLPAESLSWATNREP